MMFAHVDGRPMPSSSSRLTSDASVKRAGGEVRVALRFERGDGDGVADGQRRQQRLALLGRAVLVAGLDVHLAEAGERDRGAGGRELGVRAVRRRAPRRTVTVVPAASAICDASVRCQINR